MKKSDMKKNDPSELLSVTGKTIPPSGIREFFDIVYSTPDCISLGVGEPDFVTPWRISDSAIDAIREGHTHYTPNRGLPELREAVSEYTHKKYNISYNPDSEILITTGVSEGLDLVLRSIINPGDEVIILEPCYVSYSANVSLLQGVPVCLQCRFENGFKISVDEIKKAITPKTKAILLNYPANPTGATMDKKLLTEIAELAEKHNFIVISDEIYAAISYEKKHFSIAALPGMKNRTIYLNGLSKSHAMTGWRLAYVAGPEPIISIMLKIHQYVALCSPSISQYAGVEALNHGDKDVERMLAEYTKRKNYISSRFNEIGLKCLYPEGAFYVFPEISSTGMDGRAFAIKLLEQEKVAVVPGEAFGESGKFHIRCSYATSMDALRKALDGIENFVKSL